MTLSVNAWHPRRGFAASACMPLLDVDLEFETIMAFDRKTLAMCHVKDREQRYLISSLASKAQRRQTGRLEHQNPRFRLQGSFA
jgi:hypothetical protein